MENLNFLIDNEKKDIFFNQLEISINKFAGWLKNYGYETYDLYDLMSTKTGGKIRKLYYHNNIIGSILVIPIILMDMFIPSLARSFIKKKRFAIADSHLIMGYLNLYDYYDNKEYLNEAIEIGNELLLQSSSGYSGYCWGYPVNWESRNGFWPKRTPFVSVTPYCYEAYLKLYDYTRNEKYLEIASSICDFVNYDLNEIEISGDTIALSYSPTDKTKVINASAYGAYILTESYNRFGNETYLNKANKLVNFILKSQREDGSWLYSMDNPQEIFIDNIHTCFVLKNLYKINRVLKDKKVSDSIVKGYDYYRNKLFYQNGEPKPFSLKNKFSFLKIEIYDYAESISLGILLNELIKEAMTLSLNLTTIVINKYLTKKGHAITRIYFPHKKIKIPFLRWAQAQLFLALTEVLILNK